jgi:hypothetical protein
VARYELPAFHGRIEEGKICLELREAFANLVERLEGQDIEIILRRRTHRRSLAQNSFYWSCVIPLIAEHCGYEPEEIHSALKERFLRDRANEVNGMVKIRSTSSLNTAEFTDYLESCRRLAAELGVVIPDPDPQWHVRPKNPSRRYLAGLAR